MMKRQFTALILIIFLGWTSAPFTSAQDAPSGSRLKILLANDDGYDAPGLKALIDAFSPIADIFVAAPAEQQSGTGHGITYREPIMVRSIRHEGGFPWYAIGARPATCVRLALEALVTTKPDLVISGINAGENLGITTFLSGTLAAAREAAFSNLPTIAVSMGGNNNEDYKAAAAYVKQLVAKLQEQKLLGPGLYLNVNVPAGVAKEIKGVRLARLSLKPVGNSYERRTSPRGQVYYWNTYRPVEDDDEGTDVHAFVRGFITITPMSLDQTKTTEMEAFRGLAEAAPAGGQSPGTGTLTLLKRVSGNR